MLGISDSGQPVQNVNEGNRDTLDPSNPEVQIGLYGKDLSDLQHLVYIPRTREFPDIVFYDDLVFTVYDTETSPPSYTLALVAEGYAEPKHKEVTDD